MFKKYQHKYKVESSRLSEWDYSNNGYYFVTICVKDRKCVLGDIKEGMVVLSEIGSIVAEEWQRTEQIRKNVKLDQWIIMPNHLHGIIELNNHIVETHCNASLRDAYQNQFGPQRNNISSIIRGFKGITTKRIREDRIADFSWQPRFYDHIIRDDDELNRIREYIINNPLKWELDKENVENIDKKILVS